MSEPSLVVAQLQKTNETLSALLTNEPDVAAIVSQIKALGEESVTPADIKAAQLDKTINILRKHANTEISSATTALITAWKNQSKAAVAKAAEAAAIATVSQTDQTVTQPEQTQTTTATTQESSTTTQEPQQQPQDNTADDDAQRPPSPQKRKQPVEVVYTMGQASTAIRNTIQQKLLEALTNASNKLAVPIDNESLIGFAVTIESACFGRFQHNDGPQYKERIRILLAHIRMENNSEFIEAIANGAFSPEELSTMPPQEMAPSHIKMAMQKEKEFELEKRKTDRNLGQVGVDMFPCPKCKARSTTYYQKQTRSADEPMTTFCTCTKCGKRWRIY